MGTNKTTNKTTATAATKDAVKTTTRNKAAAKPLRAGAQPAKAVARLRLVGKFPQVDVKPAPARPKHLSPAQMAAMLKLMKLA